MTISQNRFIKCKKNCETCEKCLTHNFIDNKGAFVGCEKYVEFAYTKTQLQQKKIIEYNK